MPSTSDQWKIRFGQIFQYYLQQNQKKLADYLYFLPAGTTYNNHSKDAFQLIDLHKNPTLYETHFSGDIPAIHGIDLQQGQNLGWTVVIVPGFGHHWLKEKAFQLQIPLLKSLGFKVIYAKYEDSFESNQACALRVAKIITDEWDSSSPLIFLGYSKGTPVIMELLRNGANAAIIAKTKAIVSFAGAIRGAPGASSESTKQISKLLKNFRRYNKVLTWPNRLFHKVIAGLAKTNIKFFKEWDKLLSMCEDFADDLSDLPDGIEDLSRINCRNDFEHLHLPEHIGLFSLSAVYPEEEIKKMRNPDDAFLYFSGKELYDKDVFNDLQLLLSNSRFFPENGPAVDLGILKMHHWGIALRRVIGSNYEHRFPREELIKTVFTLLLEYHN